ncbi:MAG: calcium-binding protein [Novosphingobium sp.]|uniref:calcium-binding protein n=1 Tax=Novosphingobium sp. TaxID=1874826 RepID=UPI00301873B4
MPKTIKGTNSAETLTGTSGDDVIEALGGRDILIGLRGNDVLDGGSGADRMLGGPGNDTYMIDSVSDRAVELANEGTDTVLTTLAQYTLPSHVENLTFSGRANHSGFGNGLANVIIGNQGNDRLFGGRGADTLIGNGGRDYISGGVGNDILRGGSDSDTLNGGSGSDLLDGGLGDDRMFGGLGNDIYLVDNARDQVFDVASGGVDEVRSTVDFKLGSQIEKLTIVGAYSSNGTGNELDNTLVGNDKVNVLDGDDGNDSLDGRKGNDKLTGGQGADKFVFSTAPNTTANSDLITDFSHTQGDKIMLSLDIFTDFDGAGRITADNFLAGADAMRAQEDSQFLIYNTTTGVLYYDAEGTSGRGPIAIAQMGQGDHPELTWLDFLIIG